MSSALGRPMPELGKTYDIPPCLCPYCGRKVEAMTGQGHNSAPKNGDIAICIGCHGVQVFEGGIVRKAGVEEVREILEQNGAPGRQFKAAVRTLAVLDRLKHLRS